ncbi:MAG: hypothetical protein RR956_02570, partial [Christensenella sp.]
KITLGNVLECNEEFSIEEDNVNCFIYYFLYKYFDKNLIYNKCRYENRNGFIGDFEWCLTHNFYTYATLFSMLDEIDNVALLLKSNYDDPSLSVVKKHFSIFYMCSQECDDYKSSNDKAIPQHIDVVINFYNRFSSRMRKMMKNNMNAQLISVMGP